MPEKANISLLWNDYLTRINHRFTHLTEVISVGFDRAISWEIGESSFFFRLPSLRTYTGEMVVHGDNVAGWNCTPGTSSVTSLHLPRCGLSLNALETLVSSCKALEHLEYSDGRNDWWEPDRPFEASQLAEALISQKDSLKSLNLCLSDLWAGHSLNFSCIAPLKEFTRLSRIHIDYNLLSRPSSGHELYDILPASLEDLSVNDPLDLEPLARLATDGRRSCPRLKQVHIGHTTRPLHVLSRSYRDHRQIPGFADMKTAFDNAGIAFDSFLSDDFRGSLHALEAFPDSDDETESFELGDNPFYDSDDPNDFPGFDDIDDYNDAYGGY